MAPGYAYLSIKNYLLACTYNANILPFCCLGWRRGSEERPPKNRKFPFKTLIDGSSKQVSEGVDLVQKAVQSLQDIYDAINGVSTTVKHRNRDRR